MEVLLRSKKGKEIRLHSEGFRELIIYTSTTTQSETED